MRYGKRIEAWPRDVRASLEGKEISDGARRAIGRLLGWAERKGLPPFEMETITTFVDFIEASLEPSSCREVLGYLGHGLIALEPESEWTWLLTRRRAAGRQARAHKSAPTIPVGGHKRIFSLPIAAWPEIYRARWQSAVNPGTAHDPFGEFVGGSGPLSELSDERRDAIADSWGMFLKVALDAHADPILDPALVQMFVSGLKDRAARPRTIHSYLTRLDEGAEVLEPGNDRRWLREEANRFFAESKRQPKRKDGRVVSGEKLLALGFILCDEARRKPRALHSTAVLFRDGVMIALLAVAPARISNFASIEIGRHLDLTSIPGHLAWRASETKQRQEQTHRLPLEVRRLIDEYIAVYRNRLLDGYGGARLWVAEHGGDPLQQSGVRIQIKKHTLDRLGVDVTPHLFRDAVAVTVSERAPNEMEIATLALRHGSAESTRPYRDQASTISAATIAQEAIEADRHDQAKKVRAAKVPIGEEDEVFRRFS